MNYIIKTQTNGYFCGWDMFGRMKFIEEKRLAYRMRSNVAETTLKKVTSLLREPCSIMAV